MIYHLVINNFSKQQLKNHASAKYMKLINHILDLNFTMSLEQ